MKKLTVVFALLTLFSITFKGQDNYINGVVKDIKTKELLPYTIITDPTKFFYYGISDTIGKFNLDKNKLSEKVKFNMLGYEPLIIEIENIPDVVYLKSKPIELAEVTITGYTAREIINLATKAWNDRYPKSPYLASGIYTKTVKSHDQYIDFLQGFGYFNTSGYQSYSKFDNLDSYFQFIMTNVRASNSYAKAGENTILEPKRSSKRNFSYDSGEKSIFKAYRGLEAFGPISAKSGRLISHFFRPPLSNWYDFHIDSIIYGSSNTYIINFETKKEHVPSELRLEAKGSIWINASNYNIIRYSVDFINYLYIPLFNVEHMVKLPFLATIDVRFTANNNQIFPQKIVLEQFWANNPGEDFVSTRPSRKRPGSNRIIEREEIHFFDYANKNNNTITINDEAIEFRRIFSILSSNQNLNYCESFWENKNYNTYDWEKIKTDLSHYMPIEEQFKSNNNSFYYCFDNDFKDMHGWSKDTEKLVISLWDNINTIESIIKGYLKK